MKKTLAALLTAMALGACASDGNDFGFARGLVLDCDESTDICTWKKRGVSLMDFHQSEVEVEIATEFNAAANFDAAVDFDYGVTAGPWFSVAFDEGASKGLARMTPLSAAYSTTADAVNVLQYGPEGFRMLFVTNTTATGTITPAGTATGLDLNAGSPGNSDEWTATVGQPASTGGMIIPGTTPAGEACAVMNATTVSEAAGFWLLLTTPGAHVDLSSADPNYTSYAGIGIEQTDIVVSDQTDGAVDTTLNASNGVSFEACIKWSAAGVITYYVDDVNVAAAATHTLADGVPHVVRLQGLNHTGTEAPMNVVSFWVLPQ